MEQVTKKYDVNISWGEHKNPYPHTGACKTHIIWWRRVRASMYASFSVQQIGLHHFHGFETTHYHFYFIFWTFRLFFCVCARESWFIFIATYFFRIFIFYPSCSYFLISLSLFLYPQPLLAITLPYPFFFLLLANHAYHGITTKCIQTLTVSKLL